MFAYFVFFFTKFRPKFHSKKLLISISKRKLATITKSLFISLSLIVCQERKMNEKIKLESISKKPNDDDSINKCGKTRRIKMH